MGPAAKVELTLPMPVERVHADPRVRDAFGKVALQRGPIVYCLEEVDNGTGLFRAGLPTGARVTAVPRPDLLGGVVTLTVRGTSQEAEDRPAGAGLYTAGTDREAPGPGDEPARRT